MIQFLLRHVLIVSWLTAALAAQAGNEVIFVGSSTDGTTDQHAFIQSAPGTLLYTAGSSFTDNVTGAVWTNTGRTLYVARNAPFTTQSGRISVGQWNGQQMVSWSTLYAVPGASGTYTACEGLGLDTARKRLWTMASQGSVRQLYCINANPTSAGYGQLLAQTAPLNGYGARWALAPSGNFAIVQHDVWSGAPFEIIDTDPASPTFCQSIVSAPVPYAQTLTSNGVSSCNVSLDELYCYILHYGRNSSNVLFSCIAVYDRLAGAFVDFDAAAIGQQDFVITGILGVSMAIAPDRSFALLSSTLTPGSVVRVDFDYVTPGNTSAVSYANLVVPNARGISLSPDGARAAVTSTVQPVGGPGKVVIFDAATGVESASVALSSGMHNLYTTAWQDASPNGTFTTFGSGCSGSAGMPSLAPANGGRPRIGQNFPLLASNLPLSLAVMAVGFSNMATGGVALPLPLAAVGMGGCSLLVDPLVTATMSGGAGMAGYNLPIPNNSQLFGLPVYFQAFPLDPGANQLGVTASRGGMAVIGL